MSNFKAEEEDLTETTAEINNLHFTCCDAMCRAIDMLSRRL